jgi:hypothetical protein
MNNFLKLISCIAIISISRDSVAGNLNIGTNLIYAKINDPKLKFVKSFEPEINTINISYSGNIKRFIYSIGTNRLNSSQTRAVTDLKGNIYQYKAKANLDSVSLGYAITKNIASFVSIGNLELKKTLYNNFYHKKDFESAIIYGAGFGYKINNHSIGMTILFPSKAIKMEFASLINYSYSIKLF